MKTEILDAVESKSLKKKVPYFEIGDTVEVQCRIQEGNKTRMQIFAGTVIARKGRGINETFTVRRVVGDEGVERIFPLHSPRIQEIEVVRRGRVRRAKLYYIRDRVGKAAKVQELLTKKPAKIKKEKPAPAAPE